MKGPLDGAHLDAGFVVVLPGEPGIWPQNMHRQNNILYNRAPSLPLGIGTTAEPRAARDVNRGYVRAGALTPTNLGIFDEGGYPLARVCSFWRPPRFGDPFPVTFDPEGGMPASGLPFIFLFFRFLLLFLGSLTLGTSAPPYERVFYSPAD